MEYIDTGRKLLQYATKEAADAALPRVKRAAPGASILADSGKFEKLRATCSDDVVLANPNRRPT